MEHSISAEKPLIIIPDDRRLTIQLMGVWQGARVGGERCARENLFLATLSEELLTDCCFVEETDDGGWELRRIGPTIGRCSGVSGETAKIDDLPAGSLLSAAVCELQTAYTSQVPNIDEGEAQDKNGQKIPFLSILLPLADASGQFIKFVACARCRDCIHDA